jgi:hypothetical protein
MAVLSLVLALRGISQQTYQTAHFTSFFLQWRGKRINIQDKPAVFEY